MNKYIKLASPVVLLIILAQCREVQTKTSRFLPPEYSDPYLWSFKDKHIKYVISEKQSSVTDPFPDTIELDRRGNVTRMTRFGEEERREYDERNLLVRKWLSSDVTMQYVARYSLRHDTLVQSWRELNSHEWARLTDTTTRPHDVNLFLLDHGQIIQEFTDGVGPIYIYDRNGLVRKETEIGLNDGEKFHMETVAEFKYNGQGDIKVLKERKLNLQESQYEFYFSNGQLDSCHYSEHQILMQRFRYRYVYY